MLKVTTLHGKDHQTFPEPDGRVVETIEYNKRQQRLTVLVQTEESDVDAPFDPTELSVDDLRSKLSGAWTEAELQAVLSLEEAGDNRSTATAAIKEAIERL